MTSVADRGDSNAAARLPCQVCGRVLTVRGDGLTKPHNTRRHNGYPCRGVGYRHARWPVGQLLNHHSGDLWEIKRDIGGAYGDYDMCCLRGREKGRVLVAHGEYMHRHGWRIAGPYSIAVRALKRLWLYDETPGTVVDWIFAALDQQGDTTVPRTPEAREEAVVMASMVFTDLAGEGIDHGALVSNVLRAIETLVAA